MKNVCASAAATKQIANIRYTKPTKWLTLDIRALSKGFLLSCRCVGAIAKNHNAAKIIANATGLGRNALMNASVWSARMGRFIAIMITSTQGWRLRFMLDRCYDHLF